MSAPGRWKPLPQGGFTGTHWRRSGAIDGQDPYLVWAEADDFAGYAQRHRGHGKIKWLPIVIELAADATVRALVDASHTRWLQIPQVYQSVPGLCFCSARVKPAFFEQLRKRPALQQMIARFELGLPVGSHTHAIHNPCEAAGKTPTPPSSQALEPKLLTGKVLGLIDGGLALANSTFLNQQGRSRVQHFWRQDSCYGGPWPSQNQNGDGHLPLDPQRAGPTPDDLGYGHELDASAIAKAMKQHTPEGGALDEEALYRHLQLWDLARPVNHGTHVMSLAAGLDIPHMPSNDNASRCDLVAVQLD